VKKRIRLVAAAAGMTGLALLASGCLTETAYTGNAAGPKVAVMGAGLVDKSMPQLHTALDPDFHVRLSGWEGDTFDEYETQRASAFNGDNPDVAVFALGLDDMVTTPLDRATPAVELAAIGRLYDRFPSACTVGVTVNEHVTGTQFDLSEAALMNQELRNRSYHMVEWSDAVASHPEYYSDNGVVPNDVGKAALASMIHDAAQLCAKGGGA
jgi:hypothetical protein